MQYGDFKILIIDEDTEVLHFLAHFLAGTGYKVETCASGKDCLESVKNFRPDILLLDNMVSGKGSTYLCQMFKSNPVYKSIYIILMSGSNAKPVHIAEEIPEPVRTFSNRHIHDVIGRSDDR
jgi:CheY-like chemotaxis protein